MAQSHLGIRLGLQPRQRLLQTITDLCVSSDIPYEMDPSHLLHPDGPRRRQRPFIRHRERLRLPACALLLGPQPLRRPLQEPYTFYTTLDNPGAPHGHTPFPAPAASDRHLEHDLGEKGGLAVDLLHRLAVSDPAPPPPSNSRSPL